jgi:hypothetical protein
VAGASCTNQHINCMFHQMSEFESEAAMRAVRQSRAQAASAVEDTDRRLAELEKALRDLELKVCCWAGLVL